MENKKLIKLSSLIGIKEPNIVCGLKAPILVYHTETFAIKRIEIDKIKGQDLLLLIIANGTIQRKY